MKETDTREYGGSAVNVIAQGTQLQGNMITASDCRIDGALRGNIESKAKIIIGRSGVVEGNIKCANIEIEGNVKAESLIVSELLSLKATANLIGYRNRQDCHRTRCGVLRKLQNAQQSRYPATEYAAT